LQNFLPEETHFLFLSRHRGRQTRTRERAVTGVTRTTHCPR